MKRFVLPLVIGLLALSLIRCAPAPPVPQPAPATGAQAQPTEAPAKEVAKAQPKILRVAATASITTWDPSASFSTEALYMANIYEPLIWVNPAGSEKTFRPALAKDWEVSDDGLTWTFHLRDGVTFHDGEPLTAEAVEKSIERTIELGTGASFIWGPVDSIEAVDELTVRMTLKRPAPLDRIVSSTYAAWIMSPKAAEQDSEWFEQGVEAGTGPYVLESYTPDQEVVLSRYEDYWGGWDENQFDKVVISIVPEQVVQAQMLEGGEAVHPTKLPGD